jgi:hypothetical protein
MVDGDLDAHGKSLWKKIMPQLRRGRYPLLRRSPVLLEPG